MDLPNSPDRSVTVTPPDAAAPAPPEDAPLTARGWLAQNGVLMLILIGLAGFVFSRVGFEGLGPVGLVALGLGFLIFIHELGHFAAAKWCDVHVKTFSIGFGPAVPGCQFTLGETTYLIGILPLGGYVNMVGEGTENDEDETNPRSFKAKNVFQRMFIISAGVIMNVLFGLLCFVAVYLYHGVDRQPATVWRTEAGSAAWEQGVRAGWRVTKIDGRVDPYFDNLKYAVANSAPRAVLEFEFTDRDGKAFDRLIEPVRDDNNSMPAIGVAFPWRLKLLPESTRKVRSTPYTYTSAAASARAVPLERGDVVLTIDGKDAGKDPWEALSRRLQRGDSDPIALTVRRGAKEETLSVPAERFAFGDTIIGTTDPDTPSEPFNVKALAIDPFQEAKRALGDPFEFRRRTQVLAGKPMVIEVQRGKEHERVKLLVPPAYTRDLGMRMKMGKVAGVRRGSGAEHAKLAKGDEITQVGLKFRDGPVDWDRFKPLDPVRLPDALYAAIHENTKERPPADHSVVVKVRATIDHDPNRERELPPMAWDDTWGVGDEAPIAPSSPMSIPQIGVAYQVESTIAWVRPGGPADLAGLKAGDEIVQLRSRATGKTPDKEDWTKFLPLSSKRGKAAEVYDQWAHYHWYLQSVEYGFGNDFPIVELKVKREGTLLPETFGPIEAEPDTTWPLAGRGLLLTPDTRRQKAESFGEAVWLGMDRSVDFIRNLLLTLRSLVIGRVSANNLGGPIEIATQAFGFANEDWFIFIQFLGIISINLAVMNFLPIPVLDGGHMVFLLYEWVRGKPPSESVKNVATIIGVVLLLSLMVFVFYLDIMRRLL